MAMTQERKVVEFTYIENEEMPPIIITMDDDDKPKVVINRCHTIWLSLNRKLIGGISEELFGKIDDLLSGHLKEQRMYETME